MDGPASPDMIVSADIIPSASPNSAVAYVIERFDYSKATRQDEAEIGELYRAYFAYLGLMFTPALDSDFVSPCDYYHFQPSSSATLEPSNDTHKVTNGAYFVVRRYDGGENVPTAPSCSSTSKRGIIVGTVGVRAYSFAEANASVSDSTSAATNFFDSFVAGIDDAKVKASIRDILASSSPTTTTANMLSPSQCCELKRMIIHPECRGRGIGKRLLDAAMRWAFGCGTHRFGDPSASKPSSSIDENSAASHGDTPIVATSSSSSDLRAAGGYSAMVLDTKRWLAAANHLYEKYGGFVDCGNYNGNFRADRFMVAVKREL